MERPSFAQIYMELALRLAQRSDCQRAQVGCVVTDIAGTQVYGVGYNGGAAGDIARCTNVPGQCGCVHAEQNALIKCRTHDRQKVLYSTTFPCRICAKMIVNSGFYAVHFHRNYRDQEESLDILDKAKVIIVMP